MPLLRKAKTDRSESVVIDIALVLVVAQWLFDLNWHKEWRRLPSRYTFWIIEIWT